MDKEIMKIFAQYMSDIDFLNQLEKNVIFEFITKFEKEKLVSFLRKCFKCTRGLLEESKVQEEGMSYYVDEQCHFMIEEKEILFELNQAETFLSLLIDLFTVIYPLGTVVELNKVFTDSLHIERKIEKVYVVIVERYVMLGERETYFQYAGTIYPVGMLGKNQLIYFNSDLIENVVYEGYRDELEESYVLLMKQEILLENKAVSFGFLEEERMDKYKKELRGNGNGETKY